MSCYIPFLRVSTKQQETDRQLADIRARAQREGWNLAAPIAEQVSGAKANTERAGVQQLLATVHRHDTVVVTEISRLGRRTSEVLHLIEELTKRGVSVLALNYNLTTLTDDGKPNPLAQMLYTFLAEFSRMERETLRERVKSGVDHARSKGRIGGRPRTAIKTPTQLLAGYPAAVKLLQAGSSEREVATTTGISRNTVSKVRKALGAEPGKQLLARS